MKTFHSLVRKYLDETYSVEYSDATYSFFNLNEKKTVGTLDITSDLELIFNLRRDDREILNEWMMDNRLTTPNEINNYLKNYKAIRGVISWGVINIETGEELNLLELIIAFQNKSSFSFIKNCYDNWFLDRKIETTEKEMGIERDAKFEDYKLTHEKETKKA